jgi:serine/threonine protein kinase
MHSIYETAAALDAAERQKYVQAAAPDSEISNKVMKMLDEIEAATDSNLSEPAHPQNTAMHPLLAHGSWLGPYEIISLLGAGGMGEVYLARDTRLDRTVAIKICRVRFTERFEREARAISSLNHHHICALFDIGREDSLEFLVMEYLEGESLESRLRRGALPIEEALRIAIQISSALDAAHRKGVVHRDLKPGNVMLTLSGAKLLDFGLAKMAGPLVPYEANATGPTALPPITAQGTILGTFQYMSPERLEGKETDPRSDIFAFGVILYEMITGRTCFEGSSHASLIVAVMSATPPRVSTIQPMASPALDRVVRRCLAKSPDDRWQSAGDLLSELEWITDDLRVSFQCEKRSKKHPYAGDEAAEKVYRNYYATMFTFRTPGEHSAALTLLWGKTAGSGRFCLMSW